MSADVSVPCASTQLNGSATDLNGNPLPKQGGYMYGGGLSALGFAADVGIQFNAQNGQVAPPKSVQAFISAQKSTGGPVGAFHLQCDATYQLTTYVTEVNSIPNLVGVLQMDGSNTPHAIMQQMLAKDVSGWSKVCGKCRTKRVTSIAVKPKGQQQTIVGTWFGLQQPYTNNPIPTITWRSVVQSSFSSANATAPAPPIPWFEDQSISNGGDTPDNAIATGLFVLIPQNLANETIGINESGPRLIIK